MRFCDMDTAEAADIDIFLHMTPDHVARLGAYRRYCAETTSLKLAFFEYRLNMLNWGWHAPLLWAFLRECNVRPICHDRRMLDYHICFGVKPLYLPSMWLVNDIKAAWPSLAKEDRIIAAYGIQHDWRRGSEVNFTIALTLARESGCRVVVHDAQEWTEILAKGFGAGDIVTVLRHDRTAWYDTVRRCRLAVDLGQGGGGRVALDCAIGRVPSLVCPDNHIGYHLFPSLAFPITNIAEILDAGRDVLSNPDRAKSVADFAYAGSDAYDASHATAILEDALNDHRGHG